MEFFHRSKWQGKWLKLLAATGVVAGAVGYGVVRAADTYGVSQQFSPNVVLSTAPLNTSTLQITVYNLTNGDMPNLNLADVLGAGISVAATPNAVNSANCPGVSIAGAGQNVTISGANGIASGKSCVFSIDVEASAEGTLNANIVAGSPFTSGNTVPTTANAQLVVSNQTYVQPTLRHDRHEATIYPGGVEHLVVDISNPNAAALPGGTFSFTIPAGTTLVGTPAYNHPAYNTSNQQPGCNGVVTVSPLTGTVTVSNLTLPPKVGSAPGVCRLDYQLTSTVEGVHTVSSPAGTFSAAGGTITNANASSTNFQVIPRPTLSLVKTFSRPVAPAVNWTIGQHPKVTLTVYNQTDAGWTNVAVADTMPAGLDVNTAAAVTGSCTAVNSTLTAGSASFVIPSVAANSSCTIVFETTVTSVPVASPANNNTAGQANNVIPANTMTRDPIGGDDGQIKNNSAADTLAIVPIAPGGPNLDTVTKAFQSVIGAGLGNTSIVDGIAGGRVRVLFTVAKTLPDGIDYPLGNIKIEDDWSVSAPHIRTNVAPGSVLPVGEIYSNNCGVDAVVHVINAKKLVLSGLAIPLGRSTCQVGVFLNVAPTIVAPDPNNGVLETNTATACRDNTNSSSSCVSIEKTSNQASIELFSAQPLQIEKTANNAKTLNLALTQQFNYNFTVKNPSSLAATNVTMLDTLPAGIRFVSPLTVTGLSCANGTVGAAPTAAGSTLTWVIPNMNGFDANGTAASCSVSVLAEADQAVAVPGTPYTNTVEIGKVTATETGRANTLSSQALVNFSAAPEGLVLTKAFANPVVFKDNGDATLDTNLFGSGFDEATMLQLTLFNSSTTVGFTNVSFTDNLPAGVRVRNPAAPITTGTTCTGAVIDTSVAGKVMVTVPSLGATVNCKVMVQVIGTVVGTYTNTIPAKSVTTAEGATNTVPTSADLTVVATTPGISVYKDVTSVNGATSLHGTQVNPGDQLTYRLVLKNNNYPAAALKDYAPLVTDVLPAGVEFVSADNGGTASGQIVTWNFSGSSAVLDRNGTFPLNVTVQVKLDATGTLANVAKLGTSSSDCATPYAGGSCLATPPVAACVMPANPLAPTAAEIANPAICQPVAVKVAAVKHTLAKDVFKTGSTSSIKGTTVAAGDLLTYQITVTDTGAGDLSMKDFVKSVSDTLPVGVTVIRINEGGVGDRTVVWDLSNSTRVLKPGESMVFTVDVKVNDDASGTLKNVAKTPTEDSNEVENPVVASQHVLLKDVRKTGAVASIIGQDVLQRDNLTYVLTIRNMGAGNLLLKTGLKELRDALPAGTAFVSASNGGVYSGGFVIWNLESDNTILAPGASKEFSFNVAVTEDASMPLVNVALTPSVSSCPINDASCIANPPQPVCVMPANVEKLTAAESADPKVCKPVVNNVQLNTTLVVEKVADRQQVELGDSLKYTIRVRNAGQARATAVVLRDTLPAGFRYIAGTARLSNNAALAEPEGAPGPALGFHLGNIAPGAEITLTYRVRVGAGAAQGDGINRATACTTQNKILCSNEGRARVKVTGGVFTDEACIAGKVFVDVDGNRLQDAEEVGVPGVRLYMETGTFFITDVEGKYSYCGLSPKSHTIKVDPATLPRSAELVPSSNRNLGDGNSLYLDVKRGELIRGDFIIGNPTDAVLNQVKARRAQGEVSGPQNERAGAPALVFESRKVTPMTSASPKEGINNTAEQAVPRVRDPQAGVESCAPGACEQAPLRVDPQRVSPALEGSSASGKP